LGYQGATTTVKILLINPPRSPHNAILAHAPAEAQRFIHRKLIGPPLGLITVAAAAAHHHVSLLDMKGEYDLDPQASDVATLTRQWLERSAPAIVGVTFIASEYPAGMAILRTVRQFDPTIVTVAGGLHATLCPGDFCDPAVDVVLPGQAGHEFRDLAAAIDRGIDPLSVPGTLVNRGGKLIAGPPPLPRAITGIDYIAPDRSLLRRWRETYRVANAPGPTTYVYTSLGCPFRCSFCSIWPQFGGRYLQRSAASIVTELAGIDDYPVVRFADANTVVDPAFIRDLFSRIRDAGIRKEYVIDMRFDTAVRHPDLIELMARAGLKVVICGFESFRQAELERYGKSADAGQIAEAVRIFDANGISLRGNYVIPPDYTHDDFAALSEFAASNSVALAGYTILTPMPGTELYTKMLPSIIDHDLSRYNFFNSVLTTSLPLDEFYHAVGSLWLIRKGTQVI
jgi:radical SAM superfamily enzyme YgiQ (UPF0313 family)